MIVVKVMRSALIISVKIGLGMTMYTCKVMADQMNTIKIDVTTH